MENNVNPSYVRQVPCMQFCCEVDAHTTPSRPTVWLHIDHIVFDLPTSDNYSEYSKQTRAFIHRQHRSTTDERRRRKASFTLYSVGLRCVAAPRGTARHGVITQRNRTHACERTLTHNSCFCDPDDDDKLYNC